MTTQAETSAPRVTRHEAAPSKWQDYVSRHPSASLYHDPRWADLIHSCFNHKTYFLVAESAEGLTGALPLVYLKSRIFGKALVSMPYFNYGGLLADDPGVAVELVSSALRFKRELGADYVELRQAAPLPGGWPVKSHKVIMLLQLPENPGLLWDTFKTKLRTRIRRAEKEGFTLHWGKKDLLDDYYAVFAENMRDLGTPVYPKRFFHAILDVFPESARIALVRRGKQALAAGFLLAHRDKIEVPWSSSRRRFNHLSPNMLLYWWMIRQSIGEGFRIFDFGRSTRDSGTFTFKQQWGALPHETFWVYPGTEATELPDHSPQNAKYVWATRVWSNLPLWVTNRCGPWIVKSIP